MIVYWFLLLLMLIIVILMVLFMKLENISKTSMGFSYPLESLWQIYCHLIDQETNKPLLVSYRILWVHVSVALFFTIFGYLLNLMSTEQIKEVHSEVIDDLYSYLSNPQWQHMTSIISPELYLYGHLITSKPGSLERSLADRINSPRGIDGIIKLESSQIEQLISILSDTLGKLLTRQSVFLVEEFGIDEILPQIFCFVDKTIPRLFYSSKKTFANGIIGSFRSHSMDPHLVKRYEYNIRSWMEGGMVTASFKTYIPQGIVLFSGYKVDWTMIKCMSGDQDIEVSLPKASSFQTFQGAFMNLAILYLISSVVWIAELFSLILKKIVKVRKSQPKLKIKIPHPRFKTE